MNSPAEDVSAARSGFFNTSFGAETTTISEASAPCLRHYYYFFSSATKAKRGVGEIEDD